MEVDWPNKPTRETWEIEQFMDCYRRLPSRRDFEIVSKGDRPDYTVRDKCTGEMFGVELTSVYIDNRSVPDDHKVEHEEDVEITYDRGQLELYLSRLVEAVSTKVTKARSKYDTSNPLILSVYVNEYISIYISTTAQHGLKNLGCLCR